MRFRHPQSDPLPMSPIRQTPPHSPGCGGCIECFWIKWSPPFHEGLMFLMLRISYRLQILLVTIRPANSGGQARSPSTQTGYRSPFSACRHLSKIISCCHPSPKSYSYSNRICAPSSGTIVLTFVSKELTGDDPSFPLGVRPAGFELVVNTPALFLLYS